MKHFIIAAEIYLAGGCFWGTEHFLKQIRGVESTEVGYANSIINQPTYQQVCSGETNAAETVKVVYDPETVNLSLLLDLYFKTIDPTSLNRQGNDRGTQYRTGIYYTNKADIAVINQAVRALADQYKNPIAIEVKPLTNFYPAENYHQDYLDKNPNGYCHINPALFEMARKANAPKSKVYQNRMTQSFANNYRQSNMPSPRKMLRNLLSGMNTGTSTVPVSTQISPPENPYLFRPTSSIPVVAGLVSPNRFKRT